MKNLVVDASVAVKWLVTETHSDVADALLAADMRHVAPDLIVVEVANALRKKVFGKEIVLEQARQSLRALPDFFVDLVNSATLARDAFDIANSVNHPVADCVYLALADSLNADFVTADLKMINRFLATRHAERIKSLADFDQRATQTSNPDAKH